MADNTIETPGEGQARAPAKQQQEAGASGPGKAEAAASAARAQAGNPQAGNPQSGNVQPGGRGGAEHGQAAPSADASGMSMDTIRNIPVTLTVVLGTVSVPVSSLMKMQRGEVISLAKKVAEPVDILANGKLIARGEIVVVEEGEPTFAISLTELVGGPVQAPSGKAR